MSRDLLVLGGSLGYLDEVYEQLQQQLGSVDASWHSLFDGAPTNGRGNGGPQASAVVPPVSEARSPKPEARSPSFMRPGVVTMSPINAQAVPSVWPLVNAFRSRGHFAANLDPLGLLETARIVELDPATWGFTSGD